MAGRQRHDEIYIELRAKILDGTFAAGTALPTFIQLGEEYSVSVATINKAIAKLKSDFLVKAVRGTGVFVADDILPVNVGGIIGVILPEFRSGVYLELIHGISQRAQDAGYSIQFCLSSYDENQECLHIDHLLQNRQIKGIIDSPCGGKVCTQHYEWMKQSRYPLVFVDRYLNHIAIPFVTCDSYNGAKSAVTKLIASGHKRIAFLSAENSFEHQWCKDRLQGYHDALTQAGIKYDTLLVAEHVSTKEVKIMLAQQNSPTAFFLASNRYLYHVLQGIELSSMPVTIAGFDEVDASIGAMSYQEIQKFIRTPLIKIIQPFAQMGRMATDCLLELIDKGQSTNSTIYLPTLMTTRKE